MYFVYLFIQLKGGPEFVRLASQPVRKLKDMYPVSSISMASCVYSWGTVASQSAMTLYKP